MDPNWLKPNAFVIQNGKLVPRSTTPEKKKNYRYVPYDPLNNPTPDDYFRETISRLQKENSHLKSELNKILSDQASKPMLTVQEHQLDLVREYQAQVLALKQELARKQQQIQQRNHQLVQKDKQILQIGNQNTRLHLRINSVVKQIEALNKAMSRKDQQILVKKQQLEQYCKTLDRLTANEKQQQNTMFTENYLTTPKIQEKGEQEEQDQFFTVQYNSMYDRKSLDRRYMTPDIQPFRAEENNQYLQLTHSQKPIVQQPNSRNPQNLRRQDFDQKSNQSKQIMSNFKNSLWSSQIKQSNSMQTNNSSRISVSSYHKR